MDALKQFLSAERYMLSPRPGKAPRKRWHVTISTTAVCILTTDELDEALARLDADRHPWGAPGVVPTDVQAAYVAATEDTSWLIWCSFGAGARGADKPLPGLVIRDHGQQLIMVDDGNCDGLERIDQEDWTLWRFRRRWTPAPPTGGA